MKCFVDGDQLVLVNDDFENLHESSAVFLSFKDAKRIFAPLVLCGLFNAPCPKCNYMASFPVCTKCGEFFPMQKV